MSLRIEVEEIQNESLRYQMENGEAVEIGWMAKNIGFWCIAIDIGRIDEQHIDEWYARYEVLRAMGVNFFCDGDGKPVEITYDDLLSHIGLKTNVSDRTRSAWLKYQVGSRMDERIRNHRREMARIAELSV